MKGGNAMTTYDKSLLRDLLDGKLDPATVKSVISEPKDSDRFQKYIEILQERAQWPERILLPLGEHLYIVKKGRERIVKCQCGYEFGPYRINWKLNSIIYVRDTSEKLDEIYPGFRKHSRADFCEVREFYCPNCGTQLEVEAVPPGYPIAFDFLPDIDAFYEWLGISLDTREAFEDKTYDITRKWAEEK
jgi:acetone carboxylase gamma subunit